MDMQSIASALVKRLLVSVAIFAVGLVAVCVLARIPSEDWVLTMLGLFPAVAPIFIMVSVIWFVVQCVRDRHHIAAEIRRRIGQ